jgi:hypothetical protein
MRSKERIFNAMIEHTGGISLLALLLALREALSPRSSDCTKKLAFQLPMPGRLVNRDFSLDSP